MNIEKIYDCDKYVNTFMKIIYLLILICDVFADDSYLQQQLMQIAADEAIIANIGANKAMMLYGTNNPMKIIERWNMIEQKPVLTNYQIEQIMLLEIQKQKILHQEKN